MLQMGEFGGPKSNNSRNTSYRNKGTYSKEQSSIMSQGHKKINSFNNLSDRMCSQADVRSSHSKFNKNHGKSNIILDNFKKARRKSSKSKKSKDIFESDIVLAKGTKFRLSKPLFGKFSSLAMSNTPLGSKFMKPFLPIPIKKSKIDEFMRHSKERSNKRSKNRSKSKWKSSPYKKKIAVKLQKLKTVINDTPERNKRHSALSKNSNMKINEYSNFIHVPKKNSSASKFPSSKKTFCKDTISQGSGRGRNRSKTKSDKFTFLTINNFKCNGFKLDCNE